MEVFKKISEVQSYVAQKRSNGMTIGFVPTMGALHEGHISLVKRAVSENNLTIVSIFVNPIQFNNPDDLAKYPRVLDKDLGMLDQADVNAVFVPDTKEMYPEPVNRHYEFGSLAEVMEGAFRPGHFNGVAIVVHKLFDIVTPDRAYFGEKDYQQLMIIKAMVTNLEIPVEIIACPISREMDGLAMSSRNARLSREMRSAAPFIYQQLQLAVQKSTTMTAEDLERFISDSFENHENLNLEYFVVADGDTLQPVRGTITPNAYGFIAVFAGDIRLIDNIRLI
jgi:pantoate--beta-alanine ligase